MTFNNKFEKPTYSKRKCLMDSESVAKDKCYKLGVWLHSEYRTKLKKVTELNEALNSQAALH
jgi:hypothetical protein